MNKRNFLLTCCKGETRSSMMNCAWKKKNRVRPVKQSCPRHASVQKYILIEKNISVMAPVWILLLMYKGFHVDVWLCIGDQDAGCVGKVPTAMHCSLMSWRRKKPFNLETSGLSQSAGWMTESQWDGIRSTRRAHSQRSVASSSYYLQKWDVTKHKYFVAVLM